jgi:hypothetical protein
MPKEGVFQWIKAENSPPAEDLETTQTEELKYELAHG